MLITPSGFQELAQADITYDQLSTRDWNSGDRLIEYGHWDGGDERSGNFIAGYDANGSLVEKVMWDMNGTPSLLTDDTKLETVTYEYNLQNRLAKVTKSVPGSPDEVTEYKYNPQGIKVQKIEDPDGSPVVTDYLIDSYNHTGYAQVLKETTGTDVKSYIVGSDVLAQIVNANTPQYLLYDGHGSTRQIVASDGSTIDDSFSYDAYGVMLGGNPTSTPTTNLLYAGEQFDVASQMYYNRARWYDTNSGRFNRVDPFSGNYSDPQSLHKYLYCHANPVNGLDPTGMDMSLTSVISAISIQAVMYGIMITAVAAPKFFAESVTALKHVFSYLMQWDTWKTGGQFVLNGIWNLITNPCQLILTVILGLISKVFVIFGLLSAIWDGIKTIGMLGNLMASKSYQMIAVVVAATIITIGVTFLIGKIIKAGGKVKAKFGNAKSKQYRKTFLEANTNVDSDDIIVHHGVERQVQRRYPGVVSDSEMHSVKNLRGIRNELNSDVHLSKIRKMWDEFYELHPDAVNKEQLLEKATEIDDLYGHLFDPPIR